MSQGWSILPRFSVRLHGGLDPLRCIEQARAAEAAGFESLWFAENPFHRGVMPIVAGCAARTGRIGLGLGIVNPYQRHPTLIAQEFGALDELSGGRARLGIGSGIAAQIMRLGFPYRPLAALRDTVAILRPMLRGEPARHNGRVFSADGATLGFRPPRAEVPIYFASMGDRSLALCGEIADGLIVSNMCPPGYTERAVAIVQQAAAAAGRPPLDIVQYVPCVVRADRNEARVAAKTAIGAMLATFWPPGEAWPPLRDTIVACSGIPKPEVVAALDRLRRGEAAATALDDRFIDAFAVAGSTEDCLAQAAHYRRAGVDELVLTFSGDHPEADMAHFAAALFEVGKEEFCDAATLSNGSEVG